MAILTRKYLTLFSLPMLILAVGPSSRRNGVKSSRNGASASSPEHRFHVTLGGIQVSLHVQEQKLRSSMPTDCSST